MKKIRLFKPSVGVEELNNIKNVFKKLPCGTCKDNALEYLKNYPFS